MKKESTLTVIGKEKMESYQLIEDHGDGLAWDSAGHETHDGQGTGHEAGDHTDHHVFLGRDRVSTELLRESDASASLETLLINRLHSS